MDLLGWNGTVDGRPSPIPLALNGEVRAAPVGLVRPDGETERRHVLDPGAGVTGLVWKVGRAEALAGVETDAPAVLPTALLETRRAKASPTGVLGIDADDAARGCGGKQYATTASTKLHANTMLRAYCSHVSVASMSSSVPCGTSSCISMSSAWKYTSSKPSCGAHRMHQNSAKPLAFHAIRRRAVAVLMRARAAAAGASGAMRTARTVRGAQTQDRYHVMCVCVVSCWLVWRLRPLCIACHE